MWNIQPEVQIHWDRECGLACDPKLFPAFRRLVAIGYMTENCHAEHVGGFISAAKQFGFDESLLPHFAKLDKVGSPLPSDMIRVDGSLISGTLARSIYHASRIKSLFRINKASVIEIGGGYGSLAMVLFELGVISSYYGVDRESPSKLQDRFLGIHGYTGKWWAFGDTTPLADLVISSFSLSELNMPLRNRYSQMFLQGCPRGYHVWNWNREGHTTDRTVHDELRWFNEIMKPTEVVHLSGEPCNHQTECGVFTWGQL